MRLTLLSRSYCHLCDEMREALAPIALEAGWEVTEVDVDAHPALEERYGERVPVLLAGGADGEPICELRLDERALRAALARRTG